MSTDTKPQLVQDDPWLDPYTGDIQNRIQRYQDTLASLEKENGSLLTFASAYTYLGLNYDKQQQGWWYREWAPGAQGLFLMGDFNGWDKTTHPLQRGEGGIWEIFLPDAEYQDRFTHGSLLKVYVVGNRGGQDRLPAYIRRVVQDKNTKDFAGQLWAPEQEFTWTDSAFDSKAAARMPIIYEAHIGMATEREGVGTYQEFADEVLPRIKKLGYNTIQLMAIQEHPYYGSFGYHVANFFAPSSRFGTPEELKYLINKAHEEGLAVIMDLVHSHAVKNEAEGLSFFDGTEGQYFHEGGRGYHNSWDSKLFNYGKREVQQFLLSNVRYWLEEFHFDGYRFDGITSMLYFHHGDHTEFDHYDKYFKDGVEWDAVTYLQLANTVAHQTKAGVMTIAEDFSGMPGIARTPEDGGIGFDFRLGMGIPDFWIKYLKEKSDDDWNIEELWSVMTNRRYKEGTIAYAESHDQAIVGDKTTAFWLMDKEMYWHMHKDDDHLVIDRGMALHKLIRLFTGALGGEGYLTFIGNEFGHPEWIDFPREGNDWSYKYARRQWSLVDHPELKYQYLNNWDEGMVTLLRDKNIPASLQAQQLNMDATNKTIVAERGNLIFLWNFHPSHAIPNYKFYVPQAGQYRIILNSDAAQFGGHNRIDESQVFETFEEDGVNKLSVYNTNRTALVLERIG